MYFVNKSERHGRSFLNFLITYKKVAKTSVFPRILLPERGNAVKNCGVCHAQNNSVGGRHYAAAVRTLLLCEKTAPDGALLYQNVEVFAEAIQAEPSLAVQQAWNVSVNADKSITLP